MRIPLEFYSYLRNTIVFFGSARTLSMKDAKRALKVAKETSDKKNMPKHEMNLKMSRYYEDARILASKFTRWSKGLSDEKRRYIICSGGGPGIMEAANRGAMEAGGKNIGLTISLPLETSGNKYISKDLNKIRLIKIFN